MMANLHQVYGELLWQAPALSLNRHYRRLSGEYLGLWRQVRRDYALACRLAAGRAVIKEHTEKGNDVWLTVLESLRVTGHYHFNRSQFQCWQSWRGSLDHG